MHPRTTAVIISSTYLFAPMLFATPADIFGGNVSPQVESEKSLLLTYMGGMGGPEDDTRYSSAAELKIEGGALEFLPTEENTGPLVLETVTYNHMKVANTIWPVDTPEVTSTYGWRTPPCDGCSADHKGVDFVPGYGSPIYAVTDGMVIEMGAGGGYGDYVVLSHLVANAEGVIEEWTTLYAHMRSGSFSEGLKIGSVVKTGDVLGAVGNTGTSTGPHLHFELKINGEHVDPLPLIGTYEVLVVTEEEYPDYMFVGETFKTVETVVRYE